MEAVIHAKMESSTAFSLQQCGDIRDVGLLPVVRYPDRSSAKIFENTPTIEFTKQNKNFVILIIR